MRGKSLLIPIILVLIILPLTGFECSLIKQKPKDGGVFKSIDEAENWEQKVFVSQEKKKTITISEVGVSYLIFDPLDSNTIYLGTTGNGIYKTTNASDQWAPTTLTTGGFAAIDVDSKNPLIIFSASANNIYKSNDGGEYWENKYIETTGATINSLKIDWFDDSKIYAATSQGAFLKSIDYGNNWEVITWIGDNIKKIHINPDDSRAMYLVTTSKLFRTTDGGDVWEDLTENLAEYTGANIINWFDFYQVNPNHIYLATNHGVLHSSDGGSSWEVIKTLLPANTPISTIAINPENQKVFYFTVGRIIHKTTDGGETWKTIENFPSSRSINYLLIDPNDPKIIYAGTPPLE